MHTTSARFYLVILRFFPRVRGAPLSNKIFVGGKSKHPELRKRTGTYLVLYLRRVSLVTSEYVDSTIPTTYRPPLFSQFFCLTSNVLKDLREEICNTPSHFLNAAPTNFNREYLAQRVTCFPVILISIK